MPRDLRPLVLVLALAAGPMAAPVARAQHAPSSTQAGPSGDAPAPDFAPDAPRTPPAVPDADPLALYRRDPDYRYAEKAKGESWLRRAWNRFWNAVGEWLGRATWDERYWRITVGLLLLGVAYGLSRLFARYGAGALYKRIGRADAAEGEALPERLDTLDLDRWLRDALDAGDARRAVRAVYLRALRTLADAGHVQYRPKATNADYLRVLAPALRDALAPLARRFEELWYGDYPARPSDPDDALRYDAALADALGRAARPDVRPERVPAPAEANDAA